ncbi:hypothetical protein KOR34_41650 [Posidoniimonas corsicana]|uniref:Uncharacterized protein n=2 Tax=Posidoniimonas corsicana TaxID=1938618 RepID=A0A5C5V3S3_9BACT|nr:hypothetical protein KOR34_41650 [Posidoniimonas corsicana]
MLRSNSIDTVRNRMIDTLSLMVFAIACQSHGQEAVGPSESKSKAVSWESVPETKVEPRDPPDDWLPQSDADQKVRWHSPGKPKKTLNPKMPNMVVYDTKHNGIGLSFTCIQCETRSNGSPTEFLDSFDEGMIRSFRRNGLDPQPRPVVRVSYMNMVGRLTRIEVRGKKSALKCDLTTPTACYSVLAVGPPGKELNDALTAFVRTIRVDPEGTQRAMPQ